MSLLYVSRVNKTNEYFLRDTNLIFYMYIFNLICESVIFLKKYQFKMLVLFSLSFVADTAMIFYYNLVKKLMLQKAIR